MWAIPTLLVDREASSSAKSEERGMLDIGGRLGTCNLVI